MYSKKLLALGMTVLMLAACMPWASAAVTVNTDGGTGEVPITITAEAATFDVAVPTAITVHLNADGSVTCPGPEAFKITNNSPAPVQVTAIQANNSGWTLASYNNGDRSALARVGVGQKKLGLQFTANSNNAATSKDGSQALTFDPAQWIVKGTGADTNVMPITTAAIASAVSAAIAENSAVEAAQIVFTIGWYEAA